MRATHVPMSLRYFKLSRTHPSHIVQSVKGKFVKSIQPLVLYLKVPDFIKLTPRILQVPQPHRQHQVWLKILLFLSLQVRAVAHRQRKLNKIIATHGAGVYLRQSHLRGAFLLLDQLEDQFRQKWSLARFHSSQQEYQ